MAPKPPTSGGPTTTSSPSSSSSTSLTPLERLLLSSLTIAALSTLLASPTSPLLASLSISLLTFTTTFSMTRWLSPTFLHAGFRGRDLCKPHCPEIPECMGAICAVVYIIAVISFIPFPFMKELVAATSGGGNRDVEVGVGAAPVEDVDALVNEGRFLHKFPHSKLASYLSAIIALQCIALLGIGDDLFDIRWRHKWWIPGLASIPLLVVYFVDFGVTSIVLPIPLQPYLGPLFDLGPLYYLYMSMVAMFCPQSINMLAGINGIEVSQCIVIALLLILNDTLYLLTPYPHPATETHLFSLFLLLPWLGASLALLYHNWYPARVFVGDTYCYFSGMLFATVGILGHFSKTLFLLLVPQLFNFLFSTPQIFGLIPCPRHRLPKLNPATGFLEPSVTEWGTRQPIGPVLQALRILERFNFVSIKTDEKGRILKTSNLTLLNLWLVLRGPMREDRLAAEITGLQMAIGLFGLFVRHKLALLVFREDNLSIVIP